MGLDQYAKDGITGEPFAEWRKHNRLDGWMQQKYTSKGGTEQFNCVPLELTIEDILELESVIISESLPLTSGFFYGRDSYKEYNDSEWGYKQNDIEFIHDAKEILDQGHTVIYTNWW